MNITEAIHVQALLVWLTDPHLTGDQGCESARESAAVLAGAARRRLGAGPTREQITGGWQDLLTTCPGCPACHPDAPSDPASQPPLTVHDPSARPDGEARQTGNALRAAQGDVEDRHAQIRAVLTRVGQLLDTEVTGFGASPVHAALTRAQTALLEAALAARPTPQLAEQPAGQPVAHSGGEVHR